MKLPNKKKIINALRPTVSPETHTSELDVVEHPDVKHVDVKKLDKETRKMYREAQEAAEERTAEVAENGDGILRFLLSSPFKLGFSVTLGVLAAVLFTTLIGEASTVILYIVAGLFIALGLDPVIRKLESFGLKRGLAMAIVFLVLLLIIGGVFAIVIPVLVEQITIMVRQAPQYLTNISTQDWFTSISAKVDDFYDVRKIISGARDFITNPDNISAIASNAVQVGMGVANAVTATIIILILSLYFSASMRSMKRGFYTLVPKTRRARVIDITEQVADSVGGYISGQVTIALVNSILGFIMMSIVGVPFPTVVAVCVFLLALIPLVGSLIATTIVTLVALLNSPTTALIALIYYLVYMQIEAYVLTPRIMSRVVSVPGAFVVIGALTGGTLLGLLGALIAIPVTASILMIVKQVWVPAQDRR